MINFLVSTHKGKRVRVYRNLHKDTFSVMSWEGDDKGRVIGYSKYVYLKDCKFVVQPAGRKKVLETKRKNVHAYVEGVVSYRDNQYLLTPVTYNPYKYEGFVYLNNENKIEKSDYVALREGKNIFAV